MNLAPPPKKKIRLMNQRYKNILKVIIVVTALVLFAQFLLPDINSPQFKEFIQGSGLLGPIIIIGYIIIAHVIAPLIGSPATFLSAAIFGIVKTMLFLYVASLISSIINFYISRKLGREWVRKLAGEKNLQEIDKLLGVSTIKIFILARIFGFAIFDVISYAAGLTKISFKKYFVITAIFPLIPLFIITFIFKDFDFTSKNNFIIWVSIIILIGGIFSFGFRKHLYKKLK